MATQSVRTQTALSGIAVGMNLQDKGPESKNRITNDLLSTDFVRCSSVLPSVCGVVQRLQHVDKECRGNQQNIEVARKYKNTEVFLSWCIPNTGSGFI